MEEISNFSLFLKKTVANEGFLDKYLLFVGL